MKSRAKSNGEEWPFFDLSHTLQKTKSSKKVILVDHFRNAATVEAVRLSALYPVGGFSAGFSIIDTTLSIPSNITVDSYHLKDSRRQLQHFNKAPQWRNTKPELEAVFYQLALQNQSKEIQQTHELTPFTCNLTPDFVKKALRHPKGFHDYTKRKLDKAFKSELKRNLQYWFVIEMIPAIGGHTKGRQRPHLHGGLLLIKNEKTSQRKQKTPISRAFHKAIGYCHPDFEERVFYMGNHKGYSEIKNITETAAVVNWAGYCFKNYTLSRLYLNCKSNLIADNATKRQARELYGLVAPKLTKLSPEDEQALKDFMSWE